MPRPQRIRAREASATAPTDDETANSQAANDPVNAAIDEGGETGQSSPTSLLEEEADPFIRELAQEAGWDPSGMRNGKPIKAPLTARDYLKRLPSEANEAKERLRRTLQTSEAIAEEARQRGIKEAEARLATAIDTGNKAEAREAAQQIAQHSGLHPQTAAWIGRNPWFDQDPIARTATAMVIQDAEKRGLSVADQLAAGEDFARKRFPEHFPEVRQAETPRETRLSSVAPLVTGGSRTASVKTTKEKGWADMPTQVRNEMTRFVRQAERRGKTTAESQGFLARAYWAEQR